MRRVRPLVNRCECLLSRLLSFGSSATLCILHLAAHTSDAFDMADIFIAYAHEDRALAKSLAMDLQARGYLVWWDAELVGSDDFYDVILEALNRARAAIVIWSKTSTKSRFVRDEARYALHHQKLVAVKVSGLDTLDIPFGFQGQHTDDIANREQVLRAVDKLGVKPASRRATVSDWELLRGSADVDQIFDFLEASPAEPHRHEAIVRLKQLMAKPGGASKSGKSAPSGLTRSNFSAFLSGLIFRVPRFQLTGQGVSTAVGAAVGYSALIFAVVLLTSNILEPLETQVRPDDLFRLYAIEGLFMGLLARFAWDKIS